jgi:hypothetical protein
MAWLKVSFPSASRVAEAFFCCDPVYLELVCFAGREGGVLFAKVFFRIVFFIGAVSVQQPQYHRGVQKVSRSQLRPAKSPKMTAVTSVPGQRAWCVSPLYGEFLRLADSTSRIDSITMVGFVKLDPTATLGRNTSFPWEDRCAKDSCCFICEGDELIAELSYDANKSILKPETRPLTEKEQTPIEP